MSLIRRVPIAAGETVQVVPPDPAEDTSGLFDWVICNPASSSSDVELVDDKSKGASDGVVFSAGAAPLRVTGQGEEVFAFAAAAAEVQVLGVARS